MALPIPFPTDQLIERSTSIGAARNLWIPSSFDYDVFEDKFWGDLIRDEYPAAKTSTGTVTFTEHNENGFLEIKSGATITNYAGQGLGHQFTGDRGVLAEFIIETPATITTWKWEVGLTDADDDAGAVNVKATPSATAADCAVFVFDTTDDANIGFVTNMTSGTTQATQDIVALVASTTYRLAVRIETNSVSAYINGLQVAGHDAGIEGGNKLTPWVFSEAMASSERILKLHKWRCIQPAY